jgi:hypothetical protein
VSVNFEKEAFKCWTPGCTFRGYRDTLEKLLGLNHWLPPAEYWERCRRHERAQEARRRLDHAVHVRRMQLLDRLHELNRLEKLAHDDGESVLSWETLAIVYSDQSEILKELTFLEDATTEELVQYFCGDES